MGLEKHLLLTGATGLVGQFLLVDLLRSRLPVAVLVRSGKSAGARSRVEAVLGRLERRLSRRLPRPVILEGELTQPDLGLTVERRSWFLQNVDSVIHSAASLSFKPAAEHPDNEPFRTNVEGSSELIRLSQRAGVREFHDISSAYVCGLRSGRILESDGPLGQTFSNDYEQSKLTVEQMVHDAGFESVTVYRPSIVVDPSPDAMQMSDRTIYYAFSVFQMLSQRFGRLDPEGLFQSLGLTGNECKNIVPADWVARCIVEIFRRPDLHGRTYHLTNPHGTSIRNLLNAFEEVTLAKSSRRKAVSKPANGWAELTQMVEQFVETFTPYFRDDPVFDQTHLVEAVKRCQISHCPEIDHEALLAISKQQLASRPQSLDADESVGTSTWQALVETLPSHDFSEDSVPLMTLMLTGHGGGDWVIGSAYAENEMLEISPGRADSGVTRISTSAENWDRIITGQLDWNEVSNNGELLIQRVPQDQFGLSSDREGHVSPSERLDFHEPVRCIIQETALKDGKDILQDVIISIQNLVNETSIQCRPADEVSIHGI